MSGLIYLAGPIDGVTQESARGWREEAAKQIGVYGFATYSPPHAFNTPDQARETPGTAQSILTVHTIAIQHCDAVLAWVGGVNVFGTAIECSQALGLGIPCFIFGGAPQSLYRHGFISAGGCWADNLDEAMIHLDEWMVRFGQPEQSDGGSGG